VASKAAAPPVLKIVTRRWRIGVVIYEVPPNTRIGSGRRRPQNEKGGTTLNRTALGTVTLSI